MTSYEELETIKMCVGFPLKFSTEMLIRTMNRTLTHNVLRIADVANLETFDEVDSLIKSFIKDKKPTRRDYRNVLINLIIKKNGIGDLLPLYILQLE